MTIETPRLVLREYAVGDFAAVQAYAGDLENIGYMLWGPNEPEHTERFIELAIGYGGSDPRSEYEMAAELRGTGEMIGGFGLSLDEGREQGMLGYILNKRFWGKGYATEAVAGLMRFGFGELLLHRIWATCDGRNRASYSVMEKNGIRREANHLRSRKDRRGEWADELRYAILREEWERRNP